MYSREDSFHNDKRAWPKKRLIAVILTIFAWLVLVFISITVYYTVSVRHEVVTSSGTRTHVNDEDPPDPTVRPGPSDSILGVYSKAAVVTNGDLCSPIGKEVLLEGGSAVDAAIAALFCEGLASPQSMGMGGGFLMIIYDHETKKGYSLNARESAPAAATEDMYDGNSTASQLGGLSVAVPGELAGYEAAHKRFGRLPWSRLVEPSIKLCRDGFPVGKYLATRMKEKEQDLLQQSTMREIFINPETNHTWNEGDILKRPKLAEFLQVVAREGADALYNGTYTDSFVSDVQQLGGIITRADMEDYQVEWQEPVQATMMNTTMYSSPLPGTGAVLSFIINLLDGFIPGPSDVITMHRITEAFKFGYGRRTELGDMSRPGFVPDPESLAELIKNLTSKWYADEIRKTIKDTETHQDPEYYGAVVANKDDHGTAHMNVLGPDGDAVAVTSTINLYFGSKVRSVTTGIILNDEMDDFSSPNVTNAFGLPPSPANFIRPGKRPLSSMSPAIFVDERGVVRLVVGSAGGSKITTANALVAVANLLLGVDIKQAIDMRRFHHQLFPMAIQYEFGNIASDVKGLQEIGHKTSRLQWAESSVTAIARLKNNITANYDFRRGGSSSGF